MERIKFKADEKKNIRKYLMTNVTSCTFTFSDGLAHQMNLSPENEIMLVKLIPRTSKSKTFEELVLKNYSSAKTVKELAHLCRYDCLKTFTRHFKESFKQTPYQWMLERKMEEILSWVMNSDMTITEIARMYGFKNVSHLVNLCNKRYGIPPQKMRLLNIS